MNELEVQATPAPIRSLQSVNEKQTVENNDNDRKNEQNSTTSTRFEPFKQDSSLTQNRTCTSKIKPQRVTTDPKSLPSINSSRRQKLIFFSIKLGFFFNV